MQSHSSLNEQRPHTVSKLALQPTRIVCGTDFSEPATQAVEVAAALAKRTGEPLVLVHAVNDQSQKDLPGELRDSLGLYARAQLHDQEERLRALQVEMIEAFRVGSPDDILLKEAAAHDARLLVLAATRRRSPARLLLGGVAERVAQASHIPTLVVRNAEPLLQWARGKRRLRVFVGADFSAPSEAALRWANWLRQIGSCDVVVAYLEPALGSYPGIDLYPSLLVDDLVLKTQLLQERHFRQHVRTLLGRTRVRVRIEKNWGRSDAHLIQLAAEEQADLIVIGTHSRRGWHRLGHHSVSRGMLHYAPFNVACVPTQTFGGSLTPAGDQQSNFHPSNP